jgi:hypothetical protein
MLPASNDTPDTYQINTSQFHAIFNLKPNYFQIKKKTNISQTVVFFARLQRQVEKLLQ